MSGRASKKTPECEQRILQILEAGNTRQAACQYVGIDQDTLTNWCRRDSDFSDRARKAEAAAEVQAVAIIRRSIQSGSTKDAKWWLERRRREEWQAHQTTELTGANGGPLEVADVSNARQRLNSRMDELAARRAARSLAEPTERTGG